MPNLGANFKNARESLGIPIEKIAAETRISTRFLTAIENEEFHLLPGGIFNRGFIRAYAEQVGLNVEQVLSEYDRTRPRPEEPAAALRSVEQASIKNSERNIYPVAGILLVLLVAGYYLATRNRGAAVEEAPPAAVQKQEPVTPPPAPIVEPPVTTTDSPPADALSTLNAPPDSTTATTALPPATAAVIPPPAQPTPAMPSPALVLDVEISELSWVKVTADGTVSQSGELQAGTMKRFTANNTIALSVGNAGGTSVKINGRDRGPLGQRGEVRLITITPQNAASVQ